MLVKARSFTGLRIGVSAAKGIAMKAKRLLYSLPTPVALI